MTDRPASHLPRQLLLPLVCLALAGMFWLVASMNAPAPAGDTPPAEPVTPAPPAETAVACDVGQPRLLRTQDRVRRLSPPVDRIRTILATGFTDEQESSPRPLDKPAGSLLLPPEKTAKRSEQLERIAREADVQTRHGFKLAGRGAYFAARSEFIKALRLVTQGLDAEHQTTLHSRSLAAGLTAVKEAEDFIPHGLQLEADLDVPAVIGAHRTPVLKNADHGKLTPLTALKCYFSFAQEQLAAAAGREVAGSMALHALGKLHAALATHESHNVRAAEPKAMTFYQAALLAYPGNHMAANDLGVLLARCGNYQQAQSMLTHSISIRQQSICWHNLAEVYRQLGQTGLAQRADRHSATVRHAEITRRKARSGQAQQSVRWIDPKTFAQSHAKRTLQKKR